MFKLPFGGKKPAASTVPASSRVQALSQQGFSEPEIIRTLRTEGYSPQEAESAMKSAVKTAALPQPQPGLPQFPPAFGQPPPQPPDQPTAAPQTQPEPFQPSPSLFPEPQPNDVPTLPEFPAQELPPVGKRSTTERRGDMEEIAESVVDEKWGVFEREVEDINGKISKIDQRLNAMETAMSEFRGVKKDDVRQIKESIDAYKETLADISEKIEGMEHAVKDSLTPMMQSLRSLSDTLKTLKSVK